jgi:hypothetical protein
LKATESRLATRVRQLGFLQWLADVYMSSRVIDDPDGVAQAEISKQLPAFANAAFGAALALSVIRADALASLFRRVNYLTAFAVCFVIMVLCMFTWLTYLRVAALLTLKIHVRWWLLVAIFPAVVLFFSWAVLFQTLPNVTAAVLSFVWLGLYFLLLALTCFLEWLLNPPTTGERIMQLKALGWSCMWMGIAFVLTTESIINLDDWGPGGVFFKGAAALSLVIAIAAAVLVPGRFRAASLNSTEPCALMREALEALNLARARDRAMSGELFSTRQSVALEQTAIRLAAVIEKSVYPIVAKPEALRAATHLAGSVRPKEGNAGSRDAYVLAIAILNNRLASPLGTARMPMA